MKQYVSYWKNESKEIVLEVFDTFLSSRFQTKENHEKNKSQNKKENHDRI